MSTSNPTPESFTSGYAQIFSPAINNYKKLTGQDLETHPSASMLDSRSAVLNTLQDRMRHFNEFRKGNEILMSYLEPIIDILFAAQGKLKIGENTEAPSSPVKPICTAILVLLDMAKDVDEGYNSLVTFFRRLQSLLQRVSNFPMSSHLTEIRLLLWKVMAEALSTLAVVTKTMKQGPIKKMWKGLMRRTDVESALRRLSTLTKENIIVAGNSEATHHDGGSTTATGELVHDVDDNLNAIINDKRRVDVNNPEILAGAQSPLLLYEHADPLFRSSDNVTIDPSNTLVPPDLASASADRNGGRALSVDQLREELREWLNPPDPSTNHRAACDIRYDGTAKWLIQDKRFRSWKKSGSLLWIRGKKGSGKTLLCSAIIEDIRDTRDVKSDWIAYYYFDSKDAAKRDVWGLLVSLVTQLGDYSCHDALSQLYTNCGNCSKQPSEAALAKCLKSMLNLRGKHPVYLIIDAVDNCPNTTGSKSAREKVLKLIEDLLRPKLPNPHICVISSPEQDIKMRLDRYIPKSRPIILSEEAGQKQDIYDYILTFVQKHEEAQTWTMEQKEIVINTLSERADGNFRWISRRLETLRGRILDLIHNTPEELGTAQDEIFEQRLQGIPEWKSQLALLLFQCLIGTVRPLRVEELAEIFATEFRQSPARVYEGTLLSLCPALIVVDDKNDDVLLFSSHWVTEFLTSNRLRTSDLANISRYYVSLQAAHMVLSRTCIGVLLRLDKTVNKTSLEDSPLAFYAAQHWVDHTQFGNVESQNMDIMKRLFDPNNSHLEAWIWMHDVDMSQRRTIGDLALHPSPRGATPLYYAALCGFSGLASYLADTHPEDLRDKRGYHGTPLHAASYKGHLDAARALLERGADVNATDGDKTPLHAAFYSNQLEAMRLLLEHGADVNARDTLHDTLLHRASRDGQLQVVDLLLRYKADTNARNRDSWIPLHWAALRGQAVVAQRLLNTAVDVNTQSLDNNTPLHFASIAGKYQVVQVLLEAKADIHIRGEHDWTPLEAARANGHDSVVELLSASGDKSRPFKLQRKEGATMKRRALLVGISYSSPSNTWSQLDGPHDDVDRYRELLLNIYGYLPEDITVLKDLPALPGHSQPTRDNMIRELKALVSDATPGDRFTFFYSGHSDQQDAINDLKEEDGMDEMLITCDEKVIVDNELHEILVPLPVGCSLLAIIDTCHSGTMLDLPHYHCNNVYVPWQSKGERRTVTLQNINVHHQAMYFANSISGVPPSIASTIEGPRAIDQPSNQPLHVDIQLGEGRLVDQREWSPSWLPHGTGDPRESMIFPSQPRYDSPEPFFVCNGWCEYSRDPHPNVLSLSACSDLQRAWEGPNGSLITILCNYFKNHCYPSLGALMSHINFQLHDNALALHEYTRGQRKKAARGLGDGFDGELDNFQEPTLSSLVRLNMDDILQL